MLEQEFVIDAVCCPFLQVSSIAAEVYRVLTCLCWKPTCFELVDVALFCCRDSSCVQMSWDFELGAALLWVWRFGVWFAFCIGALATLDASLAVDSPFEAWTERILKLICVCVSFDPIFWEAEMCLLTLSYRKAKWLICTHYLLQSFLW